nr:LuxR family transcriptional regulator [Planosporangium mesophilum]
MDRATERRAIRALLTGAATGTGGALLLHGEPGIGKSALLRHAAAEATSIAAGFDVVTLDGSASEARLPLAGLHRLLHLLLHHLDGPARDEPARLIRAIEAGCRNDERFDLSAGTLRSIRAASGPRPLLCCVDDAHWLDRETLDVLGFVARRLAGERVGLILAGCDFSGGRDGAAVPALPGVPAYRLAPLDDTTARTLIEDRVPADDVAGALVTVARGNPRALLDLAGCLSPEQRSGDAPPPTGLPPESALRRAYQARLARMPDPTRWLLLLIAADGELAGGGFAADGELAGDGLGVGELVRAAAASGTDLSALEPAEAAGLVDVIGSIVEYRQPLMRSVMYHDAPLARRRAAHLLLARTLDPATRALRHHLHRAAARYGPDDQLAADLERAAARHGGRRGTASLALERAAQLSGDADRRGTRLVAAARYAWLAGEPYRARILLRRARAGAAGAYVLARSRLLRGEIELKTGAAADAQRSLLTAAGELVAHDRHLAIAALVRAGEALCLSGDYDRYPAVARQALALRRDEEPPHVELMLEQMAGLSAMFRADYDAAAAPLRRVVELAQTLEDPDALGQASLAAFLLGDGTQAHRLGRRLAEVARTNGDAAAVPHAMQLMAMADFARGRYDAAMASYHEGVLLARRSGQENLVSNDLATLAVLAAVMGDRQTCVLRVREARTRAAAQGASRPRATSEWALAALDLVEGRAADAVARLRSVMRGQPGHGHVIVKVAATPHLVEAAAHSGDREVAVEVLTAYGPWMEQTGNPGWLALSARCRALVAGTDGEADEYFREALRQHAVGDSDFDRARTELLYGQWLRRRRRPGAAREHLRSALETFERFDARPWAGHASAELRAAGHHVEPKPVRVAESLTPQQQQIARLVADGATNREVAAHLFLSRRTVDYHLRNIFTKLGVRSRVELTRLMS